MINKAVLIHRLKTTSGLSYREGARCVDAVLDALIEGITRGERIELRGFGSFTVKTVLKKTAFYRAEIPAHGRITFRPCRKLRDSVWQTGPGGQTS